MPLNLFWANTWNFNFWMSWIQHRLLIKFEDFCILLYFLFLFLLLLLLFLLLLLLLVLLSSSLLLYYSYSSSLDDWAALDFYGALRSRTYDRSISKVYDIPDMKFVRPLQEVSMSNAKIHGVSVIKQLNP